MSTDVSPPRKNMTAVPPDASNIPQPKFFGTGIITAISGDAAFLAAFGSVGSSYSFDWMEMPLSCTVAANCTTLDQSATTTASASAPISSGEDCRASRDGQF